MSTWIVSGVILVTLLGYRALARRGIASHMWRIGYGMLLAIVVAAGAEVAGRKAWHAMRDIPVWDVEAFWVYGHAIAMGHNPYVPAALRAAALPNPPLDFLHEELDVGCVYPPPTLLILAPFGYLSLRASAIAWVSLQLIGLVACVILLWRIFLPPPSADQRLRGLGLAAALALWLPATGATLVVGQTGCLALFFLLLVWRTRERPVSGLAIVGAGFVKPLLPILWLYPLLRRQWRTFGVGIVAVAALCGLAILCFGMDTFLTYFRDNPIVRTPLSTLTEPTNASLSAVILRHATQLHLTRLVVRNPVFLTAALAIAVLTIAAAYGAAQSREHEAVVLALLIPAGMLMYPNTLSHYSVILLAPILWIWTRWADSDAGGWLAVGIAALYGLMHYDAGHETILATFAMWVFLLVYSSRITISRGRSSYEGCDAQSGSSAQFLLA